MNLEDGLLWGPIFWAHSLQLEVHFKSTCTLYVHEFRLTYYHLQPQARGFDTVLPVPEGRIKLGRVPRWILAGPRQGTQRFMVLKNAVLMIQILHDHDILNNWVPAKDSGLFCQYNETLPEICSNLGSCRACSNNGKSRELGQKACFA